MASLDADGNLEIVATALATGPLHAWNSDGSLVSGWPVTGVVGAGYPAMGPLAKGAPGWEVFSGHFAAPGALVAYTGAGVALPGWPRSSANYVATPPALADVDGDGVDEIFTEEEDWKLHAYRADGTVLPGWPTTGFTGGQERHTPAIGDLDGNGDLEIVTASGSTTPGVYVFAYHHDGTTVTGFPVLFANYGFPDTFPVIGDVDGDFASEIVAVIREPASPWRPFVKVIAGNGTVEGSFMAPGSVPYGTAPALADMDGDARPEIVVQTDTSLAVFRGTGALLPGWPVVFSGRWMGNSAPAVGDVDGDLAPDIVITTQQAGSSEFGDIRLYSRTGTLHPKFPKAILIGSGGAPAIADLDLDGRNEIVVLGSYWNGITGSYDKVWVYDLGGSNHGPVQWGQLGGGAEHRGTFQSDVLLTLQGSNLRWTPATAASGYDVVRGDLALLHASGGDFSVATQECLANDTPSSTLGYAGTPPPGGCSWFVVRAVTPLGNGTYDGRGQVASRDPGINASSAGCP